MIGNAYFDILCMLWNVYLICLLLAFFSLQLLSVFFVVGTYGTHVPSALCPCGTRRASFTPVVYVVLSLHCRLAVIHLTVDSGQNQIIPVVRRWGSMSNMKIMLCNDG